MKLLRHILACALLLGFAGLPGGCVYDYYADDEGAADAGELVTLRLRVGTIAPTRAAAEDKELIHSLRIVLVNASNGEIEYNTLIGGLDNVREWESPDTYYFRTEVGPKKIFIIANEDCTSTVNGAAGSLTALLNGKLPGDSGFEEMVNGIYFTPDFEKGLILTSSYDFAVSMNEADAENRVTKEFWLVHAATKFEFRFENYREEELSITSFSLSSIAGNGNGAGDMFLMPNLAGTERTQRFEGREYYWIDWLKAVCDATTANPDLPDNKNINELYGWITDYSLPSAEHSRVDVMNLLAGEVDQWRVTPSAPLVLPVFYASESRFGADSATGFQRYAFDITLEDDNGVSKSFADVELANLKALFRNTHVRVTVSLRTEGRLMLKIGICPWWEEDAVDIPTFD